MMFGSAMILVPVSRMELVGSPVHARRPPDERRRIRPNLECFIRATPWLNSQVLVSGAAPSDCRSVAPPGCLDEIDAEPAADVFHRRRPEQLTPAGESGFLEVVRIDQRVGPE